MHQTGTSTKPEKAIDGLFGFGRRPFLFSEKETEKELMVSFVVVASSFLVRTWTPTKSFVPSEYVLPYVWKFSTLKLPGPFGGNTGC